MTKSFLQWNNWTSKIIFCDIFRYFCISKNNSRRLIYYECSFSYMNHWIVSNLTFSSFWLKLSFWWLLIKFETVDNTCVAIFILPPNIKELSIVSVVTSSSSISKFAAFSEWPNPFNCQTKKKFEGQMKKIFKHIQYSVIWKTIFRFKQWNVWFQNYTPSRGQLFNQL